MERLRSKTQNLSSEELLDMVDKRVVQVAQQVYMSENQSETIQPTSIGGVPGYPPTLSQENLEFLDGVEYIPENIRRKYWGLLSVNNMVSQINSTFEQRRIEAGSRCVIKTHSWSGDTDPCEISQIELTVRLQQLKSKGGIERRLLAPQLTESVRRETILEEAREKKGIISSLLGR
jgi:hypothetical protein